MRIIALNGPPLSGKDTIANILVPRGYQHLKMSEPLKTALAALAGCDLEDIERIKSTELVHGMSYRQGLISLSEDWVKPTLGHNWFGHLLARKLPRDGLGVVSDCRFRDEWLPVLEAHEIRLVHLMRPGCTWIGDSGSYISLPGIVPYQIRNDGLIDELEEKMRDVLFDVD